MQFNFPKWSAAALFATVLLSASFYFVSCGQQGEVASSGRTFESVEGDPLNTRIYTLDNGLTVYLSPFKDEPRVQTMIAVRAGSKYDPAETTGLAHYLEHMLFKGTHTMGTQNWEAESKVLAQISDKFEEHKTEQDPEKKKEIYTQIDSLSYEASKFAIANEYDKMISSIGAKGTNAFTSNDMTVYVNDIPANELEKWLAIESERFSTLVLRLFHTELETVYEEFNRSQDNDGRWSFENVMKGLMPNHPYGTQSTIGEGEHLKNPSMVNIHNYFDTYYRPNNVAILISGDIDPDATIDLIEEYFGAWEAADIPEFVSEPQPEIAEPIVMESSGPQPEHVYIGYRFEGAGSRDEQMITIIDMLLSNSQAGLIDLNLNQQQKVLQAYGFPYVRKDHSVHMLYGRPREGQSLEEVRDLLLEQIELVKQGEFDDWLIEAVIKDLKLNEMRGDESNNGRASRMMEAYILEKDWTDEVNYLKSLESITKADVVEFAKAHYGNNYVVSFKRKGEPKRHKVDKPTITPVELTREVQSEFMQKFSAMEETRLEPLFVDFDKDIHRGQLASGIEFNYIQNKLNETFRLQYILDMGSNHDNELSMAIQYLEYLGTNEYTSEELKKEFFKLGLSFNVYAGDRRSYVSLSGLEESLEEGVKLFEHILANVQPDQEVFDRLVMDVLKQRADAKLNKGNILFRGMASYAKYGPDNPSTDIIPEAELKTMDINKLVEKLNQITSYTHRVFYFGQKNPEEAIAVLDAHHKVPENLLAIPEEKIYPELDITENKVYFCHYDMVQAEMIFLSKDDLYNSEIAAFSSVFNEYFGAGLSSIVFQEIREQKALAYSAYSFFTNPDQNTKSHYVQAYVGTQADKMKDAIAAMLDIMNEMPQAPEQFEAARTAAMKKIETDRITRAGIYSYYQSSKDRGLDFDLRKEVYEDLKTMTLEDLNNFFNEHIAGNNYTFLVMGSRDQVDMDVLSTYGPVQELSLEEVFNY